ncbi:hypothetical protein [Rhodococcoides kyotonense]|uniref:DNA-binding protein n=1 Tax=Rhodococcoides kyotonense TaxID=398843 RepID=A0A239CPN5_9NOCA|nr:hypothetical protein [Rhodococcus kyotonensis]SNS21343.1 hypothetical protein SAMN05421642_101102 [Rhodococcus kyotonensis]
MFVLTIDQRGSRRDVDRVEELLRTMQDSRLVRPFERTAGDEVQAVASDPRTVVDIALALVRDGSWSVGIGVGPVELPLPQSTRAGRGPAFEAARDAVTRAKNAAASVAITTADADADTRRRDAETALTLIAMLITDRTEQGHAAADLMAEGHTQKHAAELLGITKQAMSQRLSVARWNIEADGRALAERLLAELDDTSHGQASQGDT